jgi:hypothetical protein
VLVRPSTSVVVKLINQINHNDSGFIGLKVISYLITISSELFSRTKTP